MGDTGCSEPNCNGKHEARGYCARCYRRRWRKGEFLHEPRTYKHELSSVNWVELSASCSSCGCVSIKLDKRDGRWYCGKKLNTSRKRSKRLRSFDSPEQAKLQYRLDPYGLSIREFEQLQEVAAYRCMICGEATKLVIDHDHQTGDVRGLLCHRCNTGLGMFRDSVKNLQDAISYLSPSG